MFKKKIQEILSLNESKEVKEDVDSTKEKKPKEEDPQQHADSMKKAKDKREADPQAKQKSKENFQDKKKEREDNKLLPYEFTSQKDAERAAGHLGLNGAHSAGSGVYKPGSSEFSLRDAVHRKKEKQKTHGGVASRFHESLDTGAGLAMTDPVVFQVKKTVRNKLSEK